MRFGIFGAAQAGSSLPGAPMGQGFHDFIDFNVEAEALGSAPVQASPSGRA
jgi:hypothetical protein